MLIKPISSIQQHNNGWLIENYIMTNNKIYSDSFSQTFDGNNLNDKQSVIIKCISCSNTNMEKIESITNSIPVTFPFILNLLDAFLCKENGILYLIFNKYVDSLDGLLQKKLQTISIQTSTNLLSEKEALEIFFQILEGCLWLWKNNVIHCNINPTCIFYRFDTRLQKNVFIVSSFSISTLQSCPFRIIDVPSSYVAPEALDSNEYSYLCDVWSLGLILHELLFKKPFFNIKAGTDIKNQVMTTEYKLEANQKKMISCETAALLESMLKHCPNDRITKEELQKSMKKFSEYELVREVLIKYKHEKRFLKNIQLNNNVHLQYAKRLMDGAWEMAQNGYNKISKNMNGEAFTIYSSILGENEKETRFALIRYAQDLIFLNQITKAKIFGEKALELYEKNNNEKDLDFARANMIVGGIYGRVGNHKASKVYLEKAVKMLLNINQERHRLTAVTINNIGVNLKSLNDLIGAKENYVRSLNLTIDIFGREHFEVSLNYMNISSIFYCLKNYKKALKFCRSAKKSSKIYFGINHSRTKDIERLEYNILEAMKKKNNK